MITIRKAMMGVLGGVIWNKGTIVRIIMEMDRIVIGWLAGIDCLRIYFM